jgi:tripartite-type tricarboxylate transporter receptor subunit TctC
MSQTSLHQRLHAPGTPACSRRCWLRAAGGLTLASALSPLAAQDPTLEWVVGYAAGGGTDAVARAIAGPLGQRLGSTLIINNKPGAATNIAAEYVARSKDPQHVLLTADFATMAANPFLFDKLPYDVERDFKPVGLLARFPLLALVHPSVPARNWHEFQSWALAQPEGVNYASAGIGSPHHLATELLRELTGIRFSHVPYKGAAPAL